MENLYHVNEKVVVEKSYTYYTQEEVKEALLKHKPSELFVPSWSRDKSLYKLKNYTNEGVEYMCEAYYDKSFIFINWENFYEIIKNVLKDISFEKFKCYEIHTVQSRMYGCETQCEECRIKQLNKN